MKVLIIEDEVRLCEALVENLKKEKIVADAVNDGETGLDYALSGVYDAIILDIMLPVMDGLEVLKAIREKGIETPVLLLTARFQISDKIMGLDMGADDYMTKPFETEELLARLRAITRRKGEVLTDLIKYMDIGLNLRTSELSCGDEKVGLSLKEYQIMEMLIKNPEQITSKESILEKVWGYDSDAEHNHVEVYISFLRRKLSLIKAKTQISTIRGIGYRLK